MADSQETERHAEADDKEPEEGNDKAHTEAETGTKGGRVPSDE
jgi:hypothetical protein